MYILTSITIISFVGVVALFTYRFWGIKTGKVIVSDSDGGLQNTPEVVYNFCNNCINKTFLYAKYHLPWYKDKLVDVTNTIANGSNIVMFKNLINGKREINNERNSASLYLKDIAEHKNNIKQPESNNMSGK